MLGGIFYTMFGLKPVMAASVVCFFITAVFECFIKLNYERPHNTGSVWAVVRQDFSDSMRYITKEQADIAKMLLLTAVSRFFVMGIIVVGLPFIVRTVLGFNANYYGAAGLLVEKLKIHKLSALLASLGIFMIPAGAAFLIPFHFVVKYSILLLSFCGMQIAISIFSIFAVSLIQQKTPNHLIGKVMAYTSALTMCVQPVGQIVYGFLFDKLKNDVWLVFIPTGFIVCAVGLSAGEFFKKMEKEAAHKM